MGVELVWYVELGFGADELGDSVDASHYGLIIVGQYTLGDVIHHEADLHLQACRHQRTTR